MMYVEFQGQPVTGGGLTVSTSFYIPLYTGARSLLLGP